MYRVFCKFINRVVLCIQYFKNKVLYFTISLKLARKLLIITSNTVYSLNCTQYNKKKLIALCTLYRVLLIRDFKD